ncbi:beta-ketoacyl synthase N-terminal-like domain-containing protein [Streptomyces sp. NPDC059474]|uniref:beta-ketoacyl synthase N-terminal-like domain-containing protein n=1 Tax=Streptomyces sp. NPDC059474 TaxID=3346846 RepID=UPI00367596F7
MSPRHHPSRPAPGGTGNPRDAVVTGLGFCLPGGAEPVFTAAQVWDIASRGRTVLGRDGSHYGSVHLTAGQFQERLPDIPEFFSRHYTDAHRYGLVSLVEACADAELDLAAGDLGEAALLVGRGSVDANVDSYLALLGIDPDSDSATTLDALEMFVAAEQAVSPSDVAVVQGALTRTIGPCFTVSCGCSSSAVQIGNARRLIATGETDLAVVTGVDVFNVGLIEKGQRLLRGAQHAYDGMDAAGMPDLLPSFDSLMRPYDRRADCINHGEGSATVILESREAAERRGAHLYGQVLAAAMTRDGLANPLSADDSGAQLVRAVRLCLGDRWRIEQVPYINGASDGGAAVTAMEANTVRELYGPGSTVLLSSQEGCFGHHGAASGCVGLALTLMMMEYGEVCPTANCEQPADGLSFDPVPGARTRPLDFDHALSFNYQIGGVKHAMLLGGPDAT